jgi:hypothetical protein
VREPDLRAGPDGGGADRAIRAPAGLPVIQETGDKVTLDECIAGLEGVRRLLTGAVPVRVEMGPAEERGLYAVTLCTRGTWVWDRANEVSFTVPERREKK